MQLFLFIILLIALTPLLGTYIAHVFIGKKTRIHPLLSWLERGSYRVAGISPEEKMTWIHYAKALFWFNLFGFIFLFGLQVFQHFLPLDPQDLPRVPWTLAFNVSSSFTTNTNWQSYPGETTMSYLTQMLGLGVQNFLSAATGMGTLLVLIRGFIGKNTTDIGNFWVDLVRTIVYLLLPLSILLSVVLLSQGVVQTFSPYVEVQTLENAKQTIPLGPVVSQVAIKQLGSNGGGYFNTNSAHPFENPTGLTNFLEMLAILLIPAASVYAYGILIGSPKHGWILFFVMFSLWFAGFIAANFAEHQSNPIMDAYPLLEGKEVRFGTTNSILWAVSTTGTSNGSVNAMMSSLSPLAGGIALFNIMLGEIIFGGVGVGLCGMIMFVILTVFLAGLMVGRTPEYLGKKIERCEMQWVMLAVLAPGALVLIGAGLSCLLPMALSSLGNHGPHGFSEILYAFTSAAGNNGSSFAGLDANTNYFNIVLGVVMIMARFSIILPSLAVAGLLAKKKSVPTTIGTFSTNTLLFALLLISVILFVDALTFFPALSLGPIVEHLLMLQGRTFL